MDKKSNPVRGRPPLGGRSRADSVGRAASNGIKLIIGLGNPDKKYANTYHNVGFLLVDYLVKNQRNFQSQIPNFQLRKSGVYMNESGRFVAKELRRNGLKPSELLIVHDDSDIALGSYKLSFGRGAAGHHGAESVIAALRTKDFWRLRIGVRSAADLADRTQTNAEKIPRSQRLIRVSPRAKAGGFVLKQIKPADREALESVFRKAMAPLALLLGS